ncbi:hypothetical protein ACFLU6_12940 [Acidobacteriota bacterium]
MASDNTVVSGENKIRTCRWLFYISLLQLLVFFLVPVFIYPAEYLLYMEILAALTLGLIFGLYFLGVNIYGFFVDRSRRALYTAFIVLIVLWAAWAVISWLFIERMNYLLR